MIGEWLLVTDESAPELTGRNRRVLLAVRVVLGLAVLVSAVLAVLPFLMDPSRREALGDYGIGGLVVVLCVLPVWLGPFAIYQTGALSIDGDRLTAYTLRDRRVVDLGKVRRVWIRKVEGRGGPGVWAGFSGPGIPSLWLSWNVSGLGTSERVRALVLDVARRPAVQVTARARAVLGLPGAPTVAVRTVLWLRGAVLLLAYAGLMAWAIIEYIGWIVNTSPR